MARGLKAYINLNALKDNLNQVRRIAPNSQIIAMIKANGYGHGLLTSALALDAADAFGVACIEEALVLRKAGVTKKILLMEGFFNLQDELSDILKYDLDTVIHHQSQIEALTEFSKQNNIAEAYDLAKKMSIWIKINTGMNRLGFPDSDAKNAYELLSDLAIIKIQGLMTHFARADELNCSVTETQIAKFNEATKDLIGERSLANSAGILGWKAAHANWIRPGIMLYGITPFSGRTGRDEGLEPVMTLSSEIISIQNPKKGEAIGYSGTYVCPKDMRIGVIAIGYGDGYPRLAPYGTPVAIHDKIVPLVGRVSMDMMTIDLSDVPAAKVGDRVELWGPNIPVEKVAEAIGTSSYELLTSLSPRVPFYHI